MEFNITAQEAAEISSENKDVLYRDEKIFLRKVEKKIIKAAKYGDYYIKIEYWPGVREKKIAEILQNKGFKIDFGFNYDCRISWRKDGNDEQMRVARGDYD